MYLVESQFDYNYLVPSRLILNSILFTVDLPAMNETCGTKLPERSRACAPCRARKIRCVRSCPEPPCDTCLRRKIATACRPPGPVDLNETMSQDSREISPFSVLSRSPSLDFDNADCIGDRTDREQSTAEENESTDCLLFNRMVKTLPQTEFMDKLIGRYFTSISPVMYLEPARPS